MACFKKIISLTLAIILSYTSLNICAENPRLTLSQAIAAIANMVGIGYFSKLIKNYWNSNKKNKNFTIKAGNKVTYQNSTAKFQKLKTAQELAQLVVELRSGSVSAQDIEENTFWELIDYIKNHVKINSTDVQDIRMLHELAKIFRATPLGQQDIQKSLEKNGSKYASKETTDLIHSILQEKGCSTFDIPVYVLENAKETIHGKCGLWGIWIEEKKATKDTWIHEAAHFYYQHYFINLLDFEKQDNKKQEYEADSFMYNFLTPEERLEQTIDTLANGHIEPYFSNWLKILQEHNNFPTEANFKKAAAYRIIAAKKRTCDNQTFSKDLLNEWTTEITTESTLLKEECTHVMQKIT